MIFAIIFLLLKFDLFLLSTLIPIFSFIYSIYVYEEILQLIDPKLKNKINNLDFGLLWFINKELLTKLDDKTKLLIHKLINSLLIFILTPIAYILYYMFIY